MDQLVRTPVGVAGGLAAAVTAAGATVDQRWRWLHSVHVTEVAAARPDAPVHCVVEPLLDGDHRAVRLVRVRQEDVTVALVSTSFVIPRPGHGPERQVSWRSEPPDPHGLPFEGGAPLDVRPVDPQRTWVRFTEELPDALVPHSAILAAAVELLHTEPPLEVGRRALGLDLSIHLHRGFRVDDWLLHERAPSSVSGYRSFGTGRVFSSLGRLVATVSRETGHLSIGSPR